MFRLAKQDEQFFLFKISFYGSESLENKLKNYQARHYKKHVLLLPLHQSSIDRNFGENSSKRYTIIAQTRESYS